ncbi:MAG: DUF6909 family protein [Thermomicrobiales bacterium]
MAEQRDARAGGGRLPGMMGEMEIAGKRDVDLYVRTYTTLLRSSGTIKLKTLVPVHIGTHASLHALAAAPEMDMGAFMYSVQRLPACIARVHHVVLGQTARIFAEGGYPHVEEQWQPVTTPGRRRKWWYDDAETLAVFIASVSDLDDLIPTLVAYQIEWNKLHALLNAAPDAHTEIARLAAGETVSLQEEEAIAETCRASLGIEGRDWGRLRGAWGTAFWQTLATVAAREQGMTLQMLGGTHTGYSRVTQRWWGPIGATLHHHGLAERPIYFISSNTHSVVNVLSGAARRRRDALTAHVQEVEHPELLPEYEKMARGEVRASWDNFLYFAARHYFAANPHEREERTREEAERGIWSIPSEGALDVGIQVIDIGMLQPDDIDPRLRTDGELHVSGSDAVIININYPLGMAANHILTQVALNTAALKGVYVLGKAATLNGRIGDVLLSTTVFDEHTGNTYWLDNCFRYEHLAPFLVYGSALDNQKALTTRGTFLQNQAYLDLYYRENYTVVEMEAGPYLNALYEDTFPTRYPMNENVNFSQVPVDFGLIHYASDTPYSRAYTLGARGMSYYGLDSTYASTLAILRRIFEREGIITDQ